MNAGGARRRAMGTLVVQSNPAGVQVFVDGIDHGQTPARLSVTPGAHILELRGRGVPRVIPFNVTAGAEVSHMSSSPNAPETGSCASSRSRPARRSLVDGVDRGVAPLTVTDLPPGDHEVVLQTPTNVSPARRQRAGRRHGVARRPVASAAPTAGPVSGWLTVKAPFSLEIREEGRVHRHDRRRPDDDGGRARTRSSS